MEILQLFNCRGNKKSPKLENTTDTATSSIYAKTTLGTFCIPESCRDAIVEIICS